MNRKIRYFGLACFLVVLWTGRGQSLEVPLWPEVDIPHRIPTGETEVRDSTDILRISKVQVPDLELFLPAQERATGQAVIIMPGGGYHILAYHWEGTAFARWFQSKGIAALVLKYRLPTSESLDVPHLAPLSDAQRAVRITRLRASEWGIDPTRIGVMGFSAGGHLAATLSTHYDTPVYPAVDSVDSVSARPDFSLLIYPVISFVNPATHRGSREALLGPEAPDSLIRFFSPELQVTRNAPPAFLLHASDDKLVPPENSWLYYSSLKHSGVPASLHLFPAGGHGFAFAPEMPYLRDWPELMLNWLRSLD